MGLSVVMRASSANGSVTENKIVLMDPMKKNVVSNATFIDHSKLLNTVISLLQVVMPNTTNCLPEHGWFRCPVGGVTKCNPIRRACDNLLSDCEDCIDEGGLCGNACDKPSLILQSIM